MRIDINPNTKVANGYTLPPFRLAEVLNEHGEVLLLFTIKAMVRALPGGVITYRLYRCGWDGTPNSDPSISGGVPQGDNLCRTANEAQEIARMIFPVLTHAGAIPDPFEYGELDTEESEQ